MKCFKHAGSYFSPKQKSALKKFLLSFSILFFFSRNPDYRAKLIQIHGISRFARGVGGERGKVEETEEEEKGDGRGEEGSSRTFVNFLGHSM